MITYMHNSGTRSDVAQAFPIDTLAVVTFHDGSNDVGQYEQAVGVVFDVTVDELELRLEDGSMLNIPLGAIEL